MEWCKSVCGKYRIESLTSTTIAGALELVRDYFCIEELICRATEMSINPKAIDEFHELYADAALDGVSLVAVEVASGNVVAACFNKLLVATEKTIFDTYQDRFTQDSTKAVIEFIAKMDGGCDLFEKYGVDCSMELMALVTAPEHRYKKLGYFLFKASIDLARKLKDGQVSYITVEDLGPKYVHIKPRSVTTKVPAICQTIASSVGTQKIGKYLNFVVHMRVPITEFVYKGKNYAERVGLEFNCETLALPL